MEAEVSGEFELVFIASEDDAAELPEHLDPVVIGDSEDIGVVEFIEDELILQLPTRVVHPHGCSKTQSYPFTSRYAPLA